MISAIILAFSVLATATAQLFYKLFFVRGRQWATLTVSLTLFALAQVGFLVALTTIEVGVVYMSFGASQAVVLVLSHHVLRERLTRDHVIAVLLIAGGLVLYAG